MIPLDEQTVLAITYTLIKIGVFLSAFATFYFMRMQKHKTYSKAFRQYGSPADATFKFVFVLFLYLIIFAFIIYVLVNSGAF